MNRRSLLSLAAACTILAPTAARAASTIEDARLRAQIHDRLLYDARVQVSSISVETLEGKVTLRGTVTSLPERAAAVEIASAVPGVLALANELDVRPGMVEGDAAIRSEIVKRVETLPDVNGTRANVGVRGGVVSLGGSYPSLMALDKVVAEASRVEGVRDVRVTGQVEPPVPLSDALLLQNAAQALTSAEGLDAEKVRVGVRDGVVRLEGEVTALPDIVRAERVVRTLTGVRAVQNRLRMQETTPVS